MENELFNFMIKCGTIDFPQVMQEFELSIRKEILDKHPYSIWQGERGYFFTYLPDKNKRVRVKRKNLSDLEDVIVSYWKDADNNPTIREVFTSWVEYRLTSNKIEKATYDRLCTLFNKHYIIFGEKRIKNVDDKAFEEFLEKEINRCNLTSKSFANLKSLTRGFLKWAKKKDLISYNVDAMLSDIDASDKEFKKVIKQEESEVFNPKELSNLTAYLKEHLDVKNQAILLMRITGMRVGEIVSLMPDDIKDNYIFVHRTETRSIDNGKVTFTVRNFPKTAAGVRNVVVPREYTWLLNLIKNGSMDDQFVFMSKGKRITGYSLRDRLVGICKKLSIFRKTPHKLRKTYISMLLDNNVDARTIMDQVGHADISIAEMYYHRNRKTIERKQDILDNVSELST